MSIERIDCNELLKYNSDHEQRYNFAKKIVERERKTNNLIDCACGIGYGTRILSQCCNSIIGIDIDEASIKYAKKKFQCENIQFIHSDFSKIETPNNIDAFISFETIEHIDKDELFLKKISDCLIEDGILIISTPNGDVTNPWNRKPKNKYHVREYSSKAFIELIEKYFDIELVAGQYPKKKTSRMMNILKSNKYIYSLFNPIYISISLIKNLGQFNNNFVHDYLLIDDDYMININEIRFSWVLIIIAKKKINSYNK